MTERRRRFRFGIRSLLYVVGLCAFACWAYWIGWPWWEQYRFESALKQLEVGATERDIDQLSAGQTFFASTPTNKGLIGMTAFVRANFVYCIYHTYPIAAGGKQTDPCNSIAVYRLPRVPPAYPPPPSGFAFNQEEHYISDFFLFISKTPVKEPIPIIFKYELIHSDPPEAAK